MFRLPRCNLIGLTNNHRSPNRSWTSLACNNLSHYPMSRPPSCMLIVGLNNRCSKLSHNLSHPNTGQRDSQLETLSHMRSRSSTGQRDSQLETLSHMRSRSSTGQRDSFETVLNIRRWE